MAVSEIPLRPSTAQKITVTLSGITYQMRLHYADAPQGGWLLDIADASGNPIVAGIPLVTGADLLAQYKSLGFVGGLVVVTDGEPTATPTFDNLGVTSHLLYVTP